MIVSCHNFCFFVWIRVGRRIHLEAKLQSSQEIHPAGKEGFWFWLDPYAVGAGVMVLNLWNISGWKKSIKLHHIFTYFGMMAVFQICIIHLCVWKKSLAILLLPILYTFGMMHKTWVSVDAVLRGRMGSTIHLKNNREFIFNFLKRGGQKIVRHVYILWFHILIYI